MRARDLLTERSRGVSNYQLAPFVGLAIFALAGVYSLTFAYLNRKLMGISIMKTLVSCVASIIVLLPIYVWVMPKAYTFLLDYASR